MLACLPVVATRTSAVPEIVVDGETGILVEPRDAEALAAAIVRVLADPGLVRSLGEAGLARAHAEFSMSRMTDGTIAVYDEALTAT
jgi:glycosyltransferase involved in cell wall biosynthesis